MHLLILTSHFPPSWGGVESQNLDVARYMATVGHDVDVVCIGETIGNKKWKNLFSKQNINVNYVKCSLHAVSDHAYLIKRFIDFTKKKMNASESVLIEAHEKESVLAAITLIKTSRNRNAKAVWFLHGPDMFCCKNLPLLPSGEFCDGVGKQLRKYTKCVGCLSHFKRSRLNVPMQYLTLKAADKFLDLFIVKKQWFMDMVARNGYNLKKMRLIPYWVDIEEFKPMNYDVDPLFEGRVVVMNIGAIIPPWKGFEYLIDAAPLVVAQHPEVLFVNIGGLSRRSIFKAYINRLLSKIKRLKILKHFLFIPAVPRNQIPKWINSADIFAFTSYYDNYHWSFMEVLSCGKPIVVTDAGPACEIAVDGYNSLVANLNPKSVAEKINWLIEDKVLRERISVGARKTAEKRGKTKILPKLERLYLSLIE